MKGPTNFLMFVVFFLSWCVSFP